MSAIEDTTKLTYNEVLSVIDERLGRDAFYKATTSAGQPFLSLCNQAGIDVTVSPSGNVLSYSKHVVGSKPLSSSEEIAQALNSNLQSGTAAVKNTGAFDEIVNTTLEAGKIKPVSTVTKFTNGIKGVLNTPVAGKIAPALLAAATGIQLGKIIDSTIYNIGKAMGKNPPEELNPETWNIITADMSNEGLEGLNKWAFNTIFGLNPETGEATMYADENAFAYMAQYLKEIGVLNTGESETIEPIQGAAITESDLLSNDDIINIAKSHANPYGDLDEGLEKFKKSEYNNSNYIVFIELQNNGYHRVCAISKKQVIGHKVYYITPGDKQFRLYNESGTEPQINTFYTFSHYYDGRSESRAILPYGNYISLTNEASHYSAIFNVYEPIPDGISQQDGATTPTISDTATTEEILNLLKQTYPELWDNAVQQDVMQPDGSIKTYTYVPLPMPTEGEGSKIGTTGAVQNQSTVTPYNSTESQLSTLIKILTDSQNKPQGQTKELPKDYSINPTKNSNPPDTGNGNTPVVLPITGSTSSLYAIYNPTLSEINNFGAWLWSESFIEQIKKLFNDPMQAIIGLHKVYATPITGGSQNIKVGYLDSGVSSKIVTNQYTTIDCGTVSCEEYFGNVFDYSPYTNISLYLPFIGIVNLDVADVMRSSITIIYHVDVLTGACLAEVKVTRDSAGGTLYQYAGNSAVTLPISSGSYMGIVASLASIAGSVAGTIASGGAAAPMLIGAAGSALNARTQVEHSGGFSGNAGAMGGKIPYLIISRPQTEIAEHYELYIGNPSNHTVTLGSCSGYVQVKECHLENISATQNELNILESLLKGGIIV